MMSISAKRGKGSALILTWRFVLIIEIILLAFLTAPGRARAAVGVLDGDEDFKLLATRGFAQAVDGPHQQGTTSNSYAWSMEWFKGALLVGTLRQDVTAAQIWRYTPAGTGGIAGTWKLVYPSSSAGFRGGTDMGYRWMTVCNVGGTPRLYVATWGLSSGRILYSNDGTAFKQASIAGLKASDIGYRPLVCFKDPGGKTLLITSPVAVKGDVNASNNPIVLATDDPIRGTWRPYSPSRFGDSNNDSIFSIGALDTDSDGYGDTALYAGVSNHVSGGQILKTTGCKHFPCIPTWTKVVDKGAGRPLSDDGSVQNAGVSHFAQHNGAMYAGLSDNAGEKVTAELIRINPDDSFELIIGQPRLNIDTDTIAGLYCPQKTIHGTDHDCPPLSGRGAGFGKKNGTYKDGSALYFWHMLSYDPALFPQGDGRLYVGTLEGFSGSVATPGFDLLASSDDGLNWVQVTTDGLGDTSQGGLRTMAASPLGMFIGGANYASSSGNTSGSNGCDVWLGTCDPALASPPVSDPRAVLNPTMPGQVIFDGQRYVAYDDENYPYPGDGYVTVTLESRSYDPFCGDITEQKWDSDLTGGCGSLSGDLTAAVNAGPLTLCTSSSNVGDCPDYTPSASTADYNEYTFILQVTDNDGNMVCKKVVVRASKNLPPGVTVETDPPAVFSQGQWSVSLVDFDGNGSQPLTLKGMCTDPEDHLLTCTWSAEAGITFAGKTLPFEDADPGVLGTSYTAKVHVGSSLGISLTAVDDLGNTTALPVSVRARSAVDDDATQDNRPVCQGVSRTIAKNSVLTVNPATDTIGPRCADPEHQTLSYVVTQPSAGTGTVTGGSNLTYTPPQNFVGAALFTLQACDPGGNCSSVVGIRVNVQDVPPPPSGPPDAPATASAALLTGRTVHVTWTDVTDETRYEVQRCRSVFRGCSFSTIASNVAAVTTFFDNIVTSAGTYRFRVRACNAKGCSVYTQAPDLAVP